MDYSLAKELKDAGFPWKDGDWYTSDGQWIPESERVYFPTLEELIEACGEKITLNKKPDATGEFTYEAYTIKHSFISDKPTEPVARLWLALNRPSTEE